MEEISSVTMEPEPVVESPFHNLRRRPIEIISPRTSPVAKKLKLDSERSMKEISSVTITANDETHEIKQLETGKLTFLYR